MPMSKVQRLIKQHDKWYAERRDLYQTLLYEALTVKSPKQAGILHFIRPSGSYTALIPHVQCFYLKYFKHLTSFVASMQRISGYLLFNILRMNRQNLSTFCIFTDKIYTYVGIVKGHFSQICNRGSTVGKQTPCKLSFVYTSQVKLTVWTELKFEKYMMPFM